MSTRRLPVYLLLDCSESMAGPAIEAVAQGVGTLLGELRANPQAAETAYLSVITFSRDAQQVVPLTELMAFHAPKLRVRPGTALGSALRLLKDCLEREVLKSTEATKGDYRPLIFLLTDGQPTDEWEDAANSFKQGDGPKPGNLIAIGCGPDIDIEVLYRITDTVLLMPNPEPEAIRKFFVWLSSSVQAVSVRVEGGGENSPLNLPAMPPDTLEMAMPQPGGYDRGGDGMPRQVFLHAHCSGTRQPYLMRYVRREYEERYDAVASHPLDFLDEADAVSLPPINSSLLIGLPPCPYCAQRHGGICPCGALFCSPDPSAAVVCPVCNCQLGPGTGATDFNIPRTDG